MLFEVGDFGAQLVGFGLIAAREAIFEPLETGFFAVLVDLGFADVLALVNVVERRFREFEHLKGVVDLLSIDAQDALFGDAGLLEDAQDFLVVFERAIAPAGALETEPYWP